jgi:hypothetical protein
MPFLKDYKIIQEYDGLWYFSLGYVDDKNKRTWISHCSIIYLLCFALGMLVRYHPVLWNRFIGQVHVEDLPVVEQLIKVATEEFPRYTLDAFIAQGLNT